MVLAPCLLGHRISFLYYRQQCRPWDQVTPEVWIGGVLSQQETVTVLRLGVTAVLDLTAEFSASERFRTLVYRSIPLLDLTAPSQDQLRVMAEFIDQESRKGIIYVHCKIGYSRSAAAVGAYLLRSGRAGNVAQAMAILREARPGMVVRPEVISALSSFANAMQASSGLEQSSVGFDQHFSPRLGQSLLHNQPGL